MATKDSTFNGSIPQFYDSHMVPLNFQAYAEDMAARLGDLTSGHVLEIAAGTGALTSELAARLAPAVAITASDLNPAMLVQAARRQGLGRVAWQQANGMALPFADGMFDAVLCQFGVMFYPDRVAGYREAKRVLKPDGRFLFSSWGTLTDNPLTDVVNQAIAARYRDDPPQFFARTPFGYHDPDALGADLRAAGFTDLAVEVVDCESVAESAMFGAIAICQGTPMRAEIEARDPGGLAAATQAAADALTKHFGAGVVRTAMRALVATARA